MIVCHEAMCHVCISDYARFTCHTFHDGCARNIQLPTVAHDYNPRLDHPTKSELETYPYSSSNPPKNLIDYNKQKDFVFITVTIINYNDEFLILLLYIYFIETIFAILKIKSSF